MGAESHRIGGEAERSRRDIEETLEGGWSDREDEEGESVRNEAKDGREQTDAPEWEMGDGSAKGEQEDRLGLGEKERTARPLCLE